jgi:hypothetical protein
MHLNKVNCCVYNSNLNYNLLVILINTEKVGVTTEKAGEKAGALRSNAQMSTRLRSSTIRNDKKQYIN